MKKLFAMILALAMLTVSAASAATLQAVQDAGVLVMGTSPDFPPYENLVIDPVTGEEAYEGIEIDIMNLVAEKLGVTLDIKPIDFDSVLPGVQTGTYDIGVSGFTVTDERKKNVDFSDVYYIAAQVIVVLPDSEIKSSADLEGKTVAVQSGTTAAETCFEAGYNVQEYKANVDAELALVNKSVDAWVIDSTTAARMVAEYQQSTGNELVILEEALTEEPYAFAFQKGSETLITEINTVLQDLMASGQIGEIFAKYDTEYSVPAVD